MKRFSLLYTVPAVALLALTMAPLIGGGETLYMRDVLSGHFAMKVSQAEAMRHGELPLIDPYRAGGQPLVGNPNAVPLYPDNLLYLVAPPFWALNAHFWLHLLLAPFAVFWLGRAWGLGRPAAWTAGVVYATSGFFLSLFNLYNLVAGAALAPAFIAACLDAGRRRRALIWAGVLWALLLLAGDPFFAALALVLAVAARLARGEGRQELPRLAAALALGTVIAAPMIVEFLRILPLSYRGYWQYSPRAALSQSWDPRSCAELLLPFFFGRPDFTFWGVRFYGGNPPLFYSLYPGILGLALILVAGRPRRSAAYWAWGALGGGLFFALGAWNPAVRLLYHLPGAAVLRFPVKFWLAVALGGALLAGLGCERLLAGGGRRRLGWILATAGGFYLLALLVFLRLPGSAEAALLALDPLRLAGAAFARQRALWVGAAVLSLAVTALLGLATWLIGRRPAAGGALLLAVHLATQCLLLQPLYDSDDVAPYVRPPAALAAVPASARVVHGGSGDLFGRIAGAPLELFPDARFFWLARAHFAQLYPFSGVQWGRRYELNHSPEGLDSFFVISLTRALQQMDDAARIRMLEASGVDVLLLDRELAPAARERVRLRAHFPAAPARDPAAALPLYVYELPHAAPPVWLAGTTLRAPSMNDALRLLTAPELDPQAAVVLPPGSGPEPGERPPGRVEVERDAVEELAARVTSPEGGVLMTRRSFLGIYRATVDGQPATPQVANFHHLAVAVPPGEHRVRVWIDRRPYDASRLAAAGALAALAGAPWWWLGRRRDAVRGAAVS